MTTGERLKAALDPLGLPVKPDIYAGDEDQYITYNYDLLPAHHADDRPHLYRALIQVHLLAPHGVTTTVIRTGIMQALAGAGFPWPEAVNASDKDGQHYVFETETVEKIPAPQKGKDD